MKKALSILLALVLLAASVSIAFAEEASFTINLFDQYGDTWNGAALNVEKIKNGTSSGMQSVSLSEYGLKEASIEIAYEEGYAYVFRWQKGACDNECTFTITLQNEEIFQSNTCDYYEADAQVFAYCSHECVDGVCLLCGNSCGTDFSHLFDGTTCIRCGFYCEHSYTNHYCTLCGFTENDYFAGYYTYGDSEFYWSIDADKTLNISAQGLVEIQYLAAAPWAAYRNLINDIVFEEGITRIDESTLNGLTNSGTVYLPASLKDIHSLYNNFVSEFVVAEGNAYFTTQDGVLFNSDKTTLLLYPVLNERTHYEIPDTVTTIGAYSFYHAKKLLTVDFNENTETIGNSAFDLSTITEVILPEGLQTIDSSCFSSGNLRTAVLPDSLTVIPYGLFYSSDLENVVIGKGVTKIADHAFQYTDNLSVVHYTGTEEEWNAIDKLTDEDDKIETVSVHYNCQYIAGTPATCDADGVADQWYCADCDKAIVGGEVLPGGHKLLNHVCTACGEVEEGFIGGSIRPDDYTQTWSIDEDFTLTIAGTGEIEMLRTDAPWYSYINDIKNVVIEDGITAVSDQVFCNFSVCETISIPASVETFGAVYNNNTGAFVVDEDNKYLTAVDGVLFTADMKTLLIYPANSKNTSYTIPDSVETVGERAFDTASNLQTIIPGANVKNVHSMCFTLTEITQFIPVSDIEFLSNYAFYYSDLVTAVVPDSATELGYYVFEGCRQLENLVLGKGLKTIGYDVLDNTPALSVVHFTGTEEEWDAMTKKVKTYRPEDKLVNIDVHYNCQLIEGTPATCTEEGVGDKWYCAECDKVIAGGNTLPVAEHNYNEDGICTDCGDEKVTVLIGDVSGDGKITAEDARLALRASVGLETLSDEQAQAAEVTGDGIIKADDARLILRASVGLETLH